MSKARTQAAYVLVRRLGYRLGDVAVYFGREAATVGTLLARLEARLATKPKEQGTIDRLLKIVNSQKSSLAPTIEKEDTVTVTKDRPVLVLTVSLPKRR